MRVPLRSFAVLVVACAAAAAVFAHWVIDVIADFLVAHASYDDVAGHDSRGFVTAAAIVLALAVCRHALVLCCEAAAKRRFDSAKLPGWGWAIGFAALTALFASAIVPGMEALDGAIGGQPVDGLSDAFGGSILLGLSTTVACALAFGFVVFAAVRWLLSNGDRIVAAIAAVIARLFSSFSGGAVRVARTNQLASRRLRPCVARHGKRAPPSDACVRPERTPRHHEGMYDSCTHRGVLPNWRHGPHTRRRADRAGAPIVFRS